MKAKLINLLRIIVSVGLLSLLLGRVGTTHTFEVLLQGDPGYLAGAFGVYLLGMIVRSYRWQILLKAQGISLPLRRLISLYFVGAFFSLFLPSGVGGDVVRMVKLARDSRKTALSVSTVLMDRVMGLLILFAIALVSLPFGYQMLTTEIVAVILILNLLGFGSIALLLEQSAINALARRLRPLAWLLERRQVSALYQSWQDYKGCSLVGSAVMSLLFNVLLITTNILIAQALHATIDPGYFLFLIPLISFLLALPISLSGLGVRESGYVYLFGQAGVPSPVAFSMSLCFYAITVGTGLIGGILYALQGLGGLRKGECGQDANGIGGGNHSSPADG